MSDNVKEQQELADEDHGWETVLRTEQMLRDLRERAIANLGEGYDEASLLAMDRKLAAHFLYNGDEDEEEDCKDATKKDEAPTEVEIAHCRASIIVREKVLSEASSHRAMCDSLSGNDDRNLQVCQDLFDDMKKHRHAWLCIILKEKPEKAFMASRQLAHLFWLYLEADGKDEEALQVLQLFERAKCLCQSSASGDDIDGCDNAEFLEPEFHQLSFAMAERMALSEKPNEASECFIDALQSETFWECEIRHCARLLETATGKPFLSRIDLETMEMEEEDDFFCKCLQAKLEGKHGSVPWQPQQAWGCCEFCGKFQDELPQGKKMLRCVCCREAFHRGVACQKKDWKGHEVVCRSIQMQPC